MSEWIDATVQLFSNLGYVGMFFGMFLSNSFIPFPSEIVMIPAGIAVATGNFGFFLAVLAGTLGGICGSLFNYVLALTLGREVLLRWKVVKKGHIDKSEKFFEKFGILSVLFGSVMPVIRQYISVPAGLSKMKAYKFTACIGVGVFIWVSFLTSLGYFVGDNKAIILQALNNFNVVLILLVVVTLSVLVLTKFKKWRKCRVATKAEIKAGIKELAKKELKNEIKDIIEEEVREEVEEEVKDLVKKEMKVLQKKSKTKK